MKYQKELTNKLRTDIIYPITVLNAIRLTDEGEGFLADLLDDKVDKDGAKVLSTNDYTTAEKTKLYGIQNNAEVNQNAFSTIKIAGQADVRAEHVTENLTFIAGSNVTLTTNPINKTVSIAATGTLTGTINASDVLVADSGSYYAGATVEEVLSEIANTKINKYYPVIVGSTTIESIDQYHSLKIKSTNISAVPVLQLRDGDETGYDIAYDKSTAGISINKTVLGNYNSTLLALHPDFITYKGNAIYHSGSSIVSPNITGTVSLPSTTSIGTVSSTEIGYLDGVTSSIQTQLNNKAIVAFYTFTLPSSSWTGASAPYSKVVTVTGILGTDKPKIDLVLTGVYETDLAMRKDWANIYRGVTGANTITFYADSIPVADINLQAEVVR